MKKILGILLIACVLLTGVAFADSVSGKIKAVDSATSAITVSKTDAATGASEDVKISYDAATTYTGVAAAADLKAGDNVKVEASKDAAGAWKAASVEVVKA